MDVTQISPRPQDMIDSTLMNFSFFRSEMVENNPNVPLAVETMDEQAYGSHFAGRHAAVSTLSHTIVDYPGKKMLLEQAIKVEKDATDALRTLASVTITAGAANEDLTVEKLDAMMVRSSGGSGETSQNDSNAR